MCQVIPRRDGLVVSVAASHAIGHGFAFLPSHTKDHHKNCMHALGQEIDSAVRLSERPDSVLNCLWGYVLKRSPGIHRKSRVSYPVPGFLSSARCRKSTIMDSSSSSLRFILQMKTPVLTNK